MPEHPRYPSEPQNAESKQETVALDVHLALKLFIASYDHSQGSTHPQKSIFAYLHQIRPRWRLQPSTREALTSAATETIIRLFALEGFHGAFEYETNPDSIHPSIAKEMEAFTTLLQFTANASSLEPLLAAMVNQMVCLDHLWIVQRGDGRQHRSVAKACNTRYSPRHDPFFSYLCYYALEGYTTGIAEFDQMYQDIQQYLRVQFPRQAHEDSENRTQEDFEEVLTAYQQQHPQHRIVLVLPRE